MQFCVDRKAWVCSVQAMKNRRNPGMRLQKYIYICVYIIERRADFRTVATLAGSWHLVISIWLLGLDLYAACSNTWTSWIEGQARVIVNNCDWCSCCHVWCQMQFVQQGSLVPSPSQIFSHSRVPDFISQPWLWDKSAWEGLGMRLQQEPAHVKYKIKGFVEIKEDCSYLFSLIKCQRPGMNNKN